SRRRRFGWGRVGRHPELGRAAQPPGPHWERRLRRAGRPGLAGGSSAVGRRGGPVKPARIVDAHIHLWDPGRRDWYPYLSAPNEHVAGGGAAMNRPFDLAAYRAEAEGWNVEKVINVAAATGRGSIDETLELDRRA